MSAALRQWIEVGFDSAYLVVLWALVGVMAKRLSTVTAANRPAAQRVLAAFVLLGIGDTGHVGFRVFAYLNGGLEKHAALVGIGTAATAFTVTLFYIVLLDVWRVRYGKAYGWFEWLLVMAGVFRMGLMIPAVNAWSSAVSPMPWSIIRNIPLVIQGAGLVFLLFRDASRTKDVPFRRSAWMIVLSFACYIPVILFAPQHPLVGMLMIPKTCAYLAVAFILAGALFRGRAAVPAPQ